MQGGTSETVLFAAENLPEDSKARDRMVLGALGSPDPRQVDGLGDTEPLTSKFAIVSPDGHTVQPVRVSSTARRIMDSFGYVSLLDCEGGGT